MIATMAMSPTEMLVQNILFFYNLDKTDGTSSG